MWPQNGLPAGPLPVNLNNNSLLFLHHTPAGAREPPFSNVQQQSHSPLNCPNIEKHAKHEFVCFIQLGWKCNVMKNLNHEMK